MFDLIHAKRPARTSRGSGPWHVSMPIAILLVLIGSVANGQQMEATTSSRAENTSPEGDITPDVIAQAWRDRERRIRTFEFRWKAKRLIPARSFPQWRDGKIVLFPKTDLDTTDTVRLVVDGTKMRCEASTAGFESRINAFVTNRPKLSIDDGVSNWSVSGGDDSRPMELYPSVFISRSTPEELGRLMPLSAIFLCFRPFAINLGEDYDISKYALRPSVSMVNQRKCLMLSKDTNDLWVDPERAFVPVRWRSVVDGEILIELTINYTQHTSGHWIPTGWEYTTYRSTSRLNLGGQGIGRVTEFTKAEVVHAELNTKISPAEFLPPEFPAGAYVTDQRRNDEAYILRHDGTTRPITFDDIEARLSYEQLIHSQGTMASLTHSRRLPLVIAAALLVISVAVIFFFRRQRDRLQGRRRE